MTDLLQAAKAFIAEAVVIAIVIAKSVLSLTKYFKKCVRKIMKNREKLLLKVTQSKGDRLKSYEKWQKSDIALKGLDSDMVMFAEVMQLVKAIIVLPLKQRKICKLLNFRKTAV